MMAVTYLMEDFMTHPLKRMAGLARFVLIAAFSLIALYKMAHAASFSGLNLGEDFVIKNSASVSFDYVTQSVCSRTAELEKQAHFQSPQGAWQADFLVVDKKRRILHLMKSGQIFRSYHVALGKKPVGKKRQEGDKKTPEGLYQIGYKNSASDFHLSLQISYPNQEDINWAREQGVDPGGDIMIHGLPNEAWKKLFINHPKSNWTRGCVAVNDQEIEEVWSYVQAGTMIELCP